jgi:catalase
MAAHQSIVFSARETAMTDPAQAIDIINERYGRHPRARALHAKGVWLRGTFTATDEARSLSRAAHLQGAPVPVLARLSNGSGDPDFADYAPDVRGLAVSFELPDGSRTDLVSQSIPRFFNSTPKDFVELVRANTGRSTAWRLPAYLLSHPKALRTLPVNRRALNPIPSFANCRFYGVHAFRWDGADGTYRHVRSDWRPADGEARIGVREARGRGRDYLRDELERRLATDAVRYVLDVQIADQGDRVDDPATHWPAERRRVDAGTLELTAIIDDPEADGSIVVFDPARVTDGIDLTADPVLRFRPQAYSESAARRSS